MISICGAGRRIGCVAAALAGLAGSPRAASAQLPDQPYVGAGGRVTIGGELSGVAGKRDDDAYFDYTDYDHNALRSVRVRLLGEWRLNPRLAVLGELRTENTDRIEAAALYARWKLWPRHELDIQAGRIPPVVGAFARRAYGRDNPVIGTPLAYQYLTSLRPDALPATIEDLLRMRGRGWRPSFPVGSQATAPGIALVSASHWDTGIEAHWRHDWLDLSSAVTRGAPAVPVVRKTNRGYAWSGRAAAAPFQGLTLGVSAARGSWISAEVLGVRPAGASLESTQCVIGADGEFGLGPVLIRSEWLRSTFDLPMAGEPGGTLRLVSSSAFVEARYRWHPRWQVAGRVEHLGFRDIGAPRLAPRPWDAPVQRVEATVGYRATRNLEIRAGWQENWRQGGRVRRRGYPALQVLYWF